MNIICIYVGTEKARFADIIMPCDDYDDDVVVVVVYCSWTLSTLLTYMIYDI